MTHIEDLIEISEIKDRNIPGDGRAEYLHVALRTLVHALIAHRKAMSGKIRPRIIGMAETMAYPPEHRVADDPIEWAFERAIRAIGDEWNKIGGFGAMEDACDRMWDEPGCGYHGVSIVDSGFDGVGNWHS